MRKLFAFLLIISIVMSVCMRPVASASGTAAYVTESDLQICYERHKDDPNFRDYFVWPEEVAFLGEFRGVEVGWPSPLLLRYYMDFALEDTSVKTIILTIFAGSVDMEKILSSNFVKKIEFVPAEMNYTGESMLKLDGSDKDRELWYSVKRGKLEYIYENLYLTYIIWEQNDRTFRLRAYDLDELVGHSDNIFHDLVSMEVEPFLEAQRQLLNIGNPNPVPPEPEKACGGSHVYDTQWDYDRNTHWYPCICGVKSSQGFHTDEDENGQCDTCQYQMRREEVQEPTAPPAQPPAPTGPVAQPTEPTQPPTASPTTPATQPPPTPAEPNTPNAGPWIGVGSGIVCVAAVAVVLLLRKKKHT